MKKLLTLALLLLGIGALAQAPVIGIYADTEATIRYSGVTPYTPLTLYIIATWSPGPLDGGITAAEFKLDNFPTNDGYPIGTVEVHHTTDLIIGDIWTDYSAAWSTSQGAGQGMFMMADIGILAFDALWIEDGRVTTVTNGDDCSCLVLVDSLYDIHTAIGLPFYFSATAAESSSWSTVKALF